MASLIGALRVTLGADTADFERGMSKAELAGKRAGQRIRQSLDGVKTALTGFAVGVGAAALVAVAQRSLEYASSLGEVAQQLGVTTKELQEYRYVASQVGVEQDVMDKSLAKLTRTIGQAATGGKAQQKVFDALGISVRDVNGQVRTAGDVMPQIADALAKIPDPARRAAVETQLFGRAGQQLDTMLAGGSKAMNELREAAHSLGLVLSDDQIQRADDTADKLAEVKQVLEAKIAGTVADNAQSIVSLASALANLTGSMVQFLGSNPEKVLTILGALAGFRAGGGLGAVAGAAAGFYAGRQMQHANDDANGDLGFRRTKLGDAQTRMNQLFALNGRGVGNPRSGPYRSAVAELKKQTELTRAATAAARLPQALGGAPVDIDLSGGGGSGGGKRTPRDTSARDRQNAIRDQYRNEDALRDLQVDELRAREDLTYDIKERGVLAQRQLELEQDGERAQVQQQVAIGDITEAEGAKRLAALKTVHSLQQEALVRDEQYQLLQEQWRLADSIGQQTEERLQLESALTRTARERREVEMRILDHAIAEERRRAQQVLDDPKSTPEAISAANRALLQSERTEGSRRELVRQQTMSPLESYLDSLPRTANEANEALENVAAGGIQSIVDGLSDAAMGAENLGDVFSNIARQIIADLIRIQIQKAIVGALGNVLGLGGGPMIGGQTGAQFSAGLGSTLSQATSSVRIPGLASGGMFPVGGRPGIDTNLLSINGQPRARVSASEHIAVLPNNGGGGRSSSTVTIVPTPYFDAVVDGRAAAVSRPMAAAAGMAGGALGEQRMMSRSRRRIP